MSLNTATTISGEGRRWRPTPAIRVSLLVHAAAVLLLAAHTETWPWALGVLAANQLVLIYAVLSPRDRLLGPNLSRLPAPAACRGEVCLTFDDGPEPDVTPQVQGELFLHRRKGRRASRARQGDCAPRSQRREPQLPSPLGVRVFRHVAIEARSGRRAADSHLDCRSAARFLSRSGRVSQSISRSGAFDRCVALRIMDAARLRYGEPRSAAHPPAADPRARGRRRAAVARQRSRRARRAARVAGRTCRARPQGRFAGGGLRRRAAGLGI
jgi:hypothetical protein